MFTGAAFLAGFVNPDDISRQGFYLVCALSIAVVALILYLTTRITQPWQAKVTAFLLVALMLFILVSGSNRTPHTFNIPSFLLLFFFASLMIPWTWPDVLWITALFYGGWWVYYIHRDFRFLRVPPTLFGYNPFLNGVIFIGLSAVICLIIRYKENERDVENFILLKDVERKNDKIQKELELASRIHKTLLPASMSTPQADISVTYLPVSKVGGDYAKYDFVDENKLIFFISDITGHGIPAALMVNRLHAEFGILAKQNHEPGVLLKKLNDFIAYDFAGTGMFLSAVCGLIDFERSKIFFSNYGHPSQYICRMRDFKIFPLVSQTTLLGIQEEPERDNFQREIDYEKGDLILLFTDGVLETKNRQGEQYGTERLKAFLKQSANAPFEEFNKKLVEELNAFNLGNFNDDVFIMSIKTRS
jgi:serine phosphatase RsbU (regulator of sigma subunit)